MAPYSWVAVAACSVLLALVAWSGFAAWAALRRVNSRLDGTERTLRGLRQQMSNMLSMLLRAGFKRGPRPNDWNDDMLKTQVMETDRRPWWSK